MNHARKVFGIGLSKTGTTSLAHALDILGYRTKDNMGVVNYIRDDLSSIDTEVLDANDAFTDTPIPSLYRQLDAKYPNSKFILTVRDMEGWLQSCKKQFTQKLSDKQNEAHNRLFLDLYDCTVFDEQKFRKGYEDFVKGVFQYFSDRPQDLLTLNVSAGDDWEKLCHFLGKPVPDIPFPKANVTKIRWMKINDITSMAQQAGNEALEIFRFIQGDLSNLRNSKVDTTRKLGYYLLKARYHYRRDQDRILTVAMNASLSIIGKGLKNLNPEIPVITPKEYNNVSNAERLKWNHFWLVDPLNGNNLSRDPVSTLFLSIALIEDRTPILGVIYAPVLDTTYYAMAGKGAFRVQKGGNPVKLESHKENSVISIYNQSDSSGLPEPAHKARSLLPYNALTLCMYAEGKHHIDTPIANTREWHTAAAQAVVNAVGMKVTCCETGKELTYNKEDFTNDCILLE